MVTKKRGCTKAETEEILNRAYRSARRGSFGEFTKDLEKHSEYEGVIPETHRKYLEQADKINKIGVLLKWLKKFDSYISENWLMEDAKTIIKKNYENSAKERVNLSGIENILHSYFDYKREELNAQEKRVRYNLNEILANAKTKKEP